MRLHLFARPPWRGAGALTATAWVLLALAATATARPADTGPAPVPSTRSTSAPTVLRETVVQPGDGGPDAIVYALIAVGAAATAIGGGYLGARIALRTRGVPPDSGRGTMTSDVTCPASRARPSSSPTGLLALVAAVVMLAAAGATASRATADLPPARGDRLATPIAAGAAWPADARAKRSGQAGLPADAALLWNSVAVDNVRASLPAKFQVEGLIYMSYVQASVYDAVVRIEGRFVPYHDFSANPAGASPNATIAAAARTALDYYLPDRAASVDAQYETYLRTLPVAGKAAGVAVGEAAANDIIALRANDGRNVPTDTYGTPGPIVAGAWQVVPPAATAQTPWVAFMRPFLLQSSSQFRADPPPDLRSRTYADDVNEVKAYGALNSTVRTTDQTATAYFWNANVINQFNQVLRDVATQHGMDLVDAVHLLAMGEMVTTDAGIACFDSKYHYLFWRPYTAIRGADLDGNPATTSDPTWTPLVNTPNHPEYPSAHGCVTAAFVRTVAKALHTRRIDIDLPGATNGGTTLTTSRHFATVHDIDNELPNARVWIGFHFRHSVFAGLSVGEDVARWTLDRYFRPVRADDGIGVEENDD